MGGVVPIDLASELQARLGLARAIETGTYKGDGAYRLRQVFPVVLTIELSEHLYQAAHRRLKDMPGIEIIHGDSRAVLTSLVDPTIGTFYWLDGHWSLRDTTWVETECPIIEELRLTAQGHPDDCIVIDDARCFAAPPPPPHDPTHWPTLLEVIDEVRTEHPEHHVTVLNDCVIVVPRRAREVVDEVGQHWIAETNRQRLVQRLAQHFRSAFPKALRG